MNARIAAAALLIGMALQPASAHAAWWNPFKKDTPPTDANAQNTPVPPVPLNTGSAAGSGAVTTTNLPPPGGSTGQPPPAGGLTAPASTGAAPNDTTMRLERIEAQMRTLTGQIEQLTYQLQQAQDRLVLETRTYIDRKLIRHMRVS